MNAYGPSGATCTVSAGSRTVRIDNGDITSIQPGMAIYFGSRDKALGSGYLITTPITPDSTPSTGGTLTLQQSSGADSAQTSQPFLIDLSYSGSPTSWAAFAAGRILNALSTMLGSLFSLGANDRQLVLDRQSTSGAARLAFSTLGTLAAYLRLVTVSGADKFRLTVSPDGTTLIDAIEVDKATGKMVTAADLTLPSLNGGQLAGFRNKIINGNFSVNQRVVSGTVTLAAGAYGHDRWKAGAAGCTYTFATSGNDTVITISAGTLLQVIDGRNIAGGVYTASQAGTAQMRVYQGAATGSYATVPLTTGSLTANTATTLEFTTGTISKVQFEPGSVATPFERWLVSTTLDLCEAYFQKSYNLATAPGTATVLGAVMSLLEATSSFATMAVQFRTRMRSTPTIVFYSPGSGASGQIGNLTAGTDVSAAILLSAQSETSVPVNVNNVSVTAGSAIGVHYTASAEL